MEEVFTKRLTRTDVQVRLHVPTHSLWGFPIAEGAHQFDFEAIDTNGIAWQFRLSTRRNDVHPRPVITKGWLAYSREKHLQEEDRIILSINEQGHGLQFRIRAQRNVIRLLGQDVWVNLEEVHQGVILN